MANRTGSELRLAELLAPLSLVMDLGRGQPPEESMHACLLAVELARAVGLPEPEVADIYYTTLLRHLGCTATSHEESQVLGDELAVRPTVNRTDFANGREALKTLRTVRHTLGTPAAVRMLRRFSGSRGEHVPRAICEVGALLAERLDMGAAMPEGVYQSYERWDGKGLPGKLKGEAIAPAARFSSLASQAIAFYNLGGVEAAVEAVGRRAGGWLDPRLAEAFCARAPALLREVMAKDVLASVVEAEPLPLRSVAEGSLDSTARAFADMVDLKTPFTHGHSSQVAELSEGAARAMGLDEPQCVAARRAGLLHDLGRVGVSDGVWEKKSALTSAEWEAVRLHAYQTERILGRVPALAPLAQIAGMHHERQDGSGYHRQATGSAISMLARILAAADAYQAMTQPRPYRQPLPAQAAAGELLDEATRGRLDRTAAEAVLSAAGDRTPRARAKHPAGLSDREVEVLRFMAQGLSNREIGQRLFISPRTAEHHAQHIYTKIGVATRAGAAMFAMQHDLIPFSAEN